MLQGECLSYCVQSLSGITTDLFYATLKCTLIDLTHEVPRLLNVVYTNLQFYIGGIGAPDRSQDLEHQCNTVTQSWSNPGNIPGTYRVYMHIQALYAHTGFEM